MIHSRYTHNGDARIHYLDSGDPTSPPSLRSPYDRGAPIVFVPGMTDVADDYTEVMTLFGRRVVVVEIRGHGRSSSPATGYDLASLSRDVGCVVDAVTDGCVHMVTFSRGTAHGVNWAIENSARVRSLAIGDYVPEERVLTSTMQRRLLDGRWRGTPVLERLDERAAMQAFGAAQRRSFWEPLSQLGIPLLVVRSGNSVLINDADWARYRQLFPSANLVEFDDSPHDIFRPDRGRYPQLVRDHVERAEI